MHGLKPISHYFFREQIALAWLDDEKFWPLRHSRRPRKKSVSSNSNKKKASVSRVTRSSVTSSNTTISSISKSCNTLNQNSITNGSFDKRLVLSDEYTHLSALATSKYSEYQLHKWSNKRTRKQIAYCADYNICLYIQCYKAFHTVMDLRRVKNETVNDKQICIIASKIEPSSLSELTSI